MVSRWQGPYYGRPVAGAIWRPKDCVLSSCIHSNPWNLLLYLVQSCTVLYSEHCCTVFYSEHCCARLNNQHCCMCCTSNSVLQLTVRGVHSVDLRTEYSGHCCTTNSVVQ